MADHMNKTTTLTPPYILKNTIYYLKKWQQFVKSHYQYAMISYDNFSMIWFVHAVLWDLNLKLGVGF